MAAELAGCWQAPREFRRKQRRAARPDGY